MIDHVACYRSTESVSPLEAEIRVAAANVYLRDHVWPAWKDYLDRAPNFSLYASGIVSRLPDDEQPVAALAMFGPADVSDAWGWHSVMGRVPFGRSYEEGNPRPRGTWLHEAGEMAVNPYLDLWFTQPKGERWAGEVCDPVQRRTFLMPVQFMGKTYEYSAPDAVTPAWFTGGSGPYNLAGDCPGPGVIMDGGYQIVQLEDGTVINRFANATGFMDAAKWSTLSRTARIVKGARVPRPASNA